MSYTKLLAAYRMGWINDEYIDRAVAVGWITPEQAIQIKASK